MKDAHLIKARAELQLLLRYFDEGVEVRRHNVERVLAYLAKIEAEV